MNKEFKVPNFSKSTLELRFEDGVICIYGTQEGLRKLSELCLELINAPSQGHIHLEDESGLLTQESQIGAIAIFKGK
jgi:hypothetical protein